MEPFVIGAMANAGSNGAVELGCTTFPTLIGGAGPSHFLTLQLRVACNWMLMSILYTASVRGSVSPHSHALFKTCRRIAMLRRRVVRSEPSSGNRSSGVDWLVT